jgi:hypothetical protein
MFDLFAIEKRVSEIEKSLMDIKEAQVSLMEKAELIISIMSKILEEEVIK